MGRGFSLHWLLSQFSRSFVVSTSLETEGISFRPQDEQLCCPAWSDFLCANVLRCILITVVCRAATRERTDTNGKLEFVKLPSTSAAELGRREEGVCLNEQLAGPVRFVAKSCRESC